ncbi:hypothetical protein [Bradyrhizobium sp. UFLA01-814]
MRTTSKQKTRHQDKSAAHFPRYSQAVAQEPVAFLRAALCSQTILSRILGDDMVEVYSNVRRDLLVVKKGFPVPDIGVEGKWRKSKKRVIRVSEEIRQVVQSQGYYMRKLSDLKKN